MTYAEAIDFLFNSLPVWERSGAGAYKPGLERVSAFAASLGDPQKRFRTVHVAGTNGKGSVCHMLAAAMQSAGYRTGLFTSPHLVDFRERIRIDGEMITREAVTEFTRRHGADMVRLGLTFFEMTTVMAFDRFARSGVEVAVIEAGLGGRLDSTNIVTPLVSVITNIGLEHTAYLGDTIAAIATEKAGIIKPGVPVVIGESDPASEPVFRARAAELDAPIVFADQNHTAPKAAVAARAASLPALDLGGDYQHKNLATVMATVDVLRRTLEIPDNALREGLQNAAAATGLRGRWQIADHRPLTVLDTAHNAHAFAEAASQIARQTALLRDADPDAQLYMILGFAGDKDTDAIIALLPRGAHYILTRAATPRALPAAELARRFAAHGFAAESIETAETVPAALDRARLLARPEDMIFVGGSNFVVGEALGSGQSG